MMIIQKNFKYLDIYNCPTCRAEGRVMEIIYKKSEFTQDDDKKLNNGVRSIAACHNVWNFRFLLFLFSYLWQYPNVSEADFRVR